MAKEKGKEPVEGLCERESYMLLNSKPPIGAKERREAVNAFKVYIQ